MRIYSPPLLSPLAIVQRYPKLVWSLILGGLVGCTTPSTIEPRPLDIEQQWQLQPGDRVSEYRISGSLGDISIELEGHSFYAPFDGKVQPSQGDCVIFSSPQVPAYLLRFCGVQRPHYGEIQEGERIGRSTVLQLAALRRQPSGQWTMVEPSRQVLEKVLR